MSFRNFDNRDRYYDREGNVLCGCLQFMIKDGTTVANVYDGDMVALANPQVTDILGRTKHQVFVDSDVIAYVYKYVGTGTISEEEAAGIDTSDESKWSLQYTVESTSIDTRSIDGTAATGISTMDNLRALAVDEVPVVDGYKVITLNGYYECGDCEPVTYVWDGESTLADDNGSVIQPEGVLTGRWIMVQPTEHCDSRHFGIFPQDSVDAEIDQSTRIGQLISYCNTHSIKPYFNGSQAYPYFIYTSVAYNSRNTIDVSNDTKFVDKGSVNRFYGEWGGNPYFVNAQTQVNSKTVRHSWHFGGYGSNTVNYIVDSDWSPVLLNGITVEIEVSPAADSQLVDCDVVCNEKITRRIVMQNLTIKTDWFADDYNWADLSVYGCQILLQNCKDANTYVLLKNKQNEANYGDLGEQTVSNQTLLANCIAENGSFTNVTIQGNAELHNISGTVLLSGAAFNLNIIDCWLSFTNTDNVTLDMVQWRRGSVTMDSRYRIQILHGLLLDNVDVQANFYTPGVYPKYRHCRINTRQDNFTDFEYIDCEVNADIYQFPEFMTLTISGTDYDGYVYRGLFAKNTVTGAAKLMLSPQSGVNYASSRVSTLGHWEGNFSDHNFVDDSRWQGISYSGAVTRAFEYKNNYGGCPVEEEDITLTMPYAQLRPYGNEPYTDWGRYCANVDGTTDTTGIWVVHDGRTTPSRDVSWDDYWIVNFHNVALPINRLFRLPYLKGVQRVIVEADITCFIRPDGYQDWPFYTNTFHVENVLLNASVTGDVQVAYASSYRPIKFHYTGIRYCDNDDIDDWNSSLDQVLIAAYNEPSNFGFAGQCRYRYTLA